MTRILASGRAGAWSRRPCPCAPCTEARRLSALAASLGVRLLARPRLRAGGVELLRTDMHVPLPAATCSAAEAEAIITGLARQIAEAERREVGA